MEGVRKKTTRLQPAEQNYESFIFIKQSSDQPESQCKMCNENSKSWKKRTRVQEDSEREEGVGRFTGVMKTSVLTPRIELRQMISTAPQKG